MLRSSSTIVVVAVVLVVGAATVSAASFSASLNAARSQGRRVTEAQALQSEVDMASKFMDSLSSFVDFKAPSQAHLRRSLGNARRAAPSMAGTCIKQNCLTVNSLCEEPNRCKCTDDVLIPCVFSAIGDRNLTQEEKGVNVSNCFPAFNACADQEGGNCIQSKNICSLLYLTIGPGQPWWNSTWTTTNCENAPATFIAQNCQFNYYCPNGTSTRCSPHVALGQPCFYESDGDGGNEFEDFNQCGNAPGELFSNSKFYCANTSRCVLREPWRAAGDSCTAATAAECFTGTCTNNKCTGIMVNNACRFTQECNAGLYCTDETNTCVPVKAFGAPCVPGSAVVLDNEETKEGNPCDAHYVCLTTNNTCGLPFQGQVGTPCTEREECAWGTHYCSPTGCAVIPATRTACDILNGDADCRATWGNESSCECYSPGAANPPARSYSCEPELTFSANSKDALLAGVNCSSLNGCHGISASKDSCFYRECLPEWRCIYPLYQAAFESVVGNCVDFAPLNPGPGVGCPAVPITTGSTDNSTGSSNNDSSGATLTVGAVVFATSMLAALL